MTVQRRSGSVPIDDISQKVLVQIQKELGRVIRSIRRTDTNWKTTRRITLKVDIRCLDESREHLAVSIVSASSLLCLLGGAVERFEASDRRDMFT